MISIAGLNVKLGDFHLENINLNVANKECLTILGPNGCGKTTLLECIAGLNGCSGRIIIDGIDVSDLPPEKRKVGYVPQDFVLFPHLTADQNVGFGLLNGKNKDRSAIARTLDLLGIGHLRGRDVRTLSAGEKQKVALARALAINPRVLLLDEPFAALDPLAKEKLRRELKNVITKVINTLEVPVIYVTHDLSEAFMMSDQIVVMSRGKIEQVGPKSEVFDNPGSPFVAEFLGFNLLEGKVVSISDETVFVKVEDVTIEGFCEHVKETSSVSVVIKPQDVILSLDKNTLSPKWRTCQCNILEGSVVEIVNLGAFSRIVTDVGFLLKSDASAEKIEDLDLTVGKKVFTRFKKSKTKLIV